MNMTAHSVMFRLPPLVVIYMYILL